MQHHDFIGRKDGDFSTLVEVHLARIAARPYFWRIPRHLDGVGATLPLLLNPSIWGFLLAILFWRSEVCEVVPSS